MFKSFKLLGAYLILGFLTLSPLLWASVPPLGDYPNHLARMAILAHIGPPELHANYVVNWQPIPNLAMDMVVPLLARLLPLEVSGRLFIAATMILLVAGTAMLHRLLHGRFGFWPLCSLIFIYNLTFWFGFLNFLFTLGVVFFAFALWIATCNWRLLPRLIAFSALASLIFLMHLFAFGIYALLIASYELGIALRQSDRASFVITHIAVRLGQFAPAAILWIWGMESGGYYKYTGFGGWGRFFIAAYAPMLFSRWPTLFDQSLLSIVVIFSIIVFFSYVAWRRRLVKLAPQMRLPLIMLLIAAAIMPEWVSGSWGAHFRLPVAIAFLAVASTQPDHWRRSAVVFVSALGIMVLSIRIWSVSQAWDDMDRRYAEFRAAIAEIPAGARMFEVESPMPAAAMKIPGVPQFIGQRDSLDFGHVLALAVIDRGAFTPSLFTGSSLITPTPRNAGMSRLLRETTILTPDKLDEYAHPTEMTLQTRPRNVYGEPPCCLDWPHRYDYVFWIDYGKRPIRIPEHLKEISSGSFFRIYRIVPR